jgi:TPR repeat protein
MTERCSDCGAEVPRGTACDHAARDQSGWLIELGPGQWRHIEDATDLGRLISEGQVARDVRVIDLTRVSDRLGQAPAFARFFPAGAATAPAPVAVPAPPVSPPPAPRAPIPQPTPGPVMADVDAWAGLSADSDLDDLDELTLPRPRGPRIVAALAVLTIAGGGFFLWRQHRQNAGDHPSSPTAAAEPAPAAPPAPAPAALKPPAPAPVASPASPTAAPAAAAPTAAPVAPTPAPAPVAALPARAPAPVASPAPVTSPAPAPAPVVAAPRAPAPAPAPAPRSHAKAHAKADPAPAYGQLLAAAQRAFTKGQNAEAAALFAKALARKPNAPEALTGLGFCELDRAQPTKAIGYFQRAARQGHTRALFGLGEAYRETGRLSASLTAFRSYRMAAPRGAEAEAAARQIADLEHRLRADSLTNTYAPRAR